jgi:hypothetical protein
VVTKLIFVCFVSCKLSVTYKPFIQSVIAECHYAECRGAPWVVQQVGLVYVFNAWMPKELGKPLFQMIISLCQILYIFRHNLYHLVNY